MTLIEWCTESTCNKAAMPYSEKGPDKNHENINQYAHGLRTETWTCGLSHTKQACQSPYREVGICIVKLTPFAYAMYAEIHDITTLFLRYTRWFKYDRDWFCINKSQFVPVIFEPPCTIKRRKANCTGHVLRRNCLLKHIIEGKIERDT